MSKYKELQEENKILKEKLEKYMSECKNLDNESYQYIRFLYYFAKEVYPKLSEDELEKVYEEYGISDISKDLVSRVANIEEQIYHKKGVKAKKPETKDNVPNENIDPNYKVGYKHPPKHTRFQKGNKGNPKGRKSKKGVPIQDLLLKEFDTKISVMQNGKIKKMYKREAISKTLVNQLLNGEAISRNILKFINDLDNQSIRKKVLEKVFKKKPE